MKEDKPLVKIRECTSLQELSACVQLQREVFELPDLEISPVRHLIVTKNAGGWSLGAFIDNELVGFLLTVPGFRGQERIFYSHMTAVAANFQGYGIGAKLKWAQRERALAEGVKYIKWTFQPVQARNAFFNLERLGAEIRKYAANFYGTDYPAANLTLGLDSDRLIAGWNLESEKVLALAQGKKFEADAPVARTIEIANKWNELAKTNPIGAAELQSRVRGEFESAFSEGLVCRGFERSETSPKYLLYKD